jgi:NADH dehydrogenase
MILITGASGFIGRHLLKSFLQHGHNAKGLACNTVDVNLPRMDLTHINRGLLVSMLDGCDTLVHSAGGYDKTLNITGTGNLLDVCAEAGVDKFIFLSSFDVMNNDSAYANSKRQAEQMLKESSLRHCIIRPSLVYGEGDRSIYALGRMIHKRPVVFVPGNGEYKRRPLYVSDLCRAVISLKEACDLPGEYNIVGPEIVTVMEIVHRLEVLLERNPFHLKIPAAVIKALGQITERARGISEGLCDKGIVPDGVEVRYGSVSLQVGLAETCKAILAL